MKDYTVIYVESWMSGSHRQSLTHMAHITTKEDETLNQALARENLLGCEVFIFDGHILLSKD